MYRGLDRSLRVFKHNYLFFKKLKKQAGVRLVCLSFTSVDPPHSFCTGIMQTEIPSHTNEADKIQWFVMRDLKRTNSKLPAYKLLAELNIEFFTPMVCKTVIRGGKRCLMKVPFMQDLLFVRDSRRHLDPIVAGIAKLQYRYIHGGQHILMTIRDADMERFKKAIESADTPRFYRPDEIKPSMIGKKVRIIGGPLHNYEGHLQKLQGSKTKRLFVELPGLITVAVEVRPDYIQLLEK